MFKKKTHPGPDIIEIGKNFIPEKQGQDLDSQIQHISGDVGKMTFDRKPEEIHTSKKKRRESGMRRRPGLNQFKYRRQCSSPFLIGRST